MRSWKWVGSILLVAAISFGGVFITRWAGILSPSKTALPAAVSSALPPNPITRSPGTDAFGAEHQAMNSDISTSTIITRTIIEKMQPVIQRISTGGSSLTQAQLGQFLADFRHAIALMPTTPTTDLENRITTLQRLISSQTYSSAASPPIGGGGSNTIAAANNIGQLSGTTINNPTITGGSISGAAFIGILSVSNASLGAATTTNLFSSIASSTNLFAQLASLGTLTLGLGTTTAGNGLNITQGCFAVGGNCLSLSSFGGTLAIAQGGTATTTQVTNGINYFDGTKITSGTALTFNGTTLGTPLFTATQTSGTSTIAAGQGFTVGSSQFVVQQGSGFVGIGTSSPTYTLHAVGTGSVGVDIVAQTISSTTKATIRSINEQGFQNQITIFASTTASRYGIPTANLALNYADGNNVLYENAGSGNSYFSTSFAVRQTITAAGNIGIGTTTPTYKLDVNGFINTDGTTGGYKQGGTTILYASSTNFSTLVGQAAPWMTSSSTAFYSTAVGYNALATTPTSGAALYNTAIGANTLSANTTGSSNTTLGVASLQLNTTGSNNTANGVNSLLSNTTGSNNTASGNSALFSNTTGGSNTANGLQSLFSNTTGINNTANGSGALFNNTTGSFNAAYGSQALYYNKSATSSVAMGSSASQGTANYSNQGGTTVGYQSGFNFANGSDYNTLMGYNSGYGITTGARNVILGQSTIPLSYNQVTTGSNNIAIGNDVAIASATASNQLVIGNLIYGTGLSGTGSTVSSGNIGIGTTSPTAQFSTTGTVRFSNFGAGTLTTDASGNLSVASDERLKTVDSQFTRGLSDIVKLSPISYHWNQISGLDMTTQYSGFSAQNVQTAIPEAVGTSSNGFLSLQDRPIIAALVNAVKEIASISGSFKVELIAWLGSASNGIGDFFARDIYATNITADSITAHQIVCVGHTCINESQLQAMLATANLSGGGNGNNVNTQGSSTPLSISIIGDNPAHIHISDVYVDLGATIIGPPADLNLAISTYLNGTLVTTIHIDTAATSTNTIDYVVTDAAGITATSTRTVFVE